MSFFYIFNHHTLQL